MPFKSQQQMEACYAQSARDKKAGRKPKWDCKEWEAETPSHILGMNKKASATFVSAFRDELAKLAAKPPTKGFQTAAQRLGKTLGKKAPINT